MREGRCVEGEGKETICEGGVRSCVERERVRVDKER